MQGDDTRRLRLHVEDEHGRHELDVDAGDSLLNVLQARDISIGSVCGGGMICGVCHVYLAARECPPPSEGERALLELSEHYDAARSRLACQVMVEARLAGARIIVAPDE